MVRGRKVETKKFVYKVTQRLTATLFEGQRGLFVDGLKVSCNLPKLKLLGEVKKGIAIPVAVEVT
jgi:hypothetical protein